MTRINFGLHTSSGWQLPFETVIKCAGYNFLCAKRHFEHAFAKEPEVFHNDKWVATSSESVKGKSWHIVLGCVELIPVIGHIVILVERFFGKNRSLPIGSESPKNVDISTPLQTNATNSIEPNARSSLNSSSTPSIEAEKNEQSRLSTALEQGNDACTQELVDKHHLLIVNSNQTLRTVRPIDDPSLKAPPTKAEFVAAIRGFKKKHQVKLKDFLVNSAWQGNQRPHYSDKDFINEDQARLREEFFNDPVIKGYLSRDSRFVLFNESRPALISDPTKPDESDYYECKIYALAAQKEGTMFLPYRANVMEDSFYQSGTFDQTIFRNVKTTSRGNKELVQKGEDIYKIRAHLREVELGQFNDEIKKEYNNIHFIISPNAKDTHATTIVSVIQKGTFRHLASIFINSCESEKYFQYTSQRFNLRSNTVNTVKLLSGEKWEPIYAKFKEQIGDKTAYVDKKKREGYLLNPEEDPFLTNTGNVEIENVYRAFEEEKIDIVHIIKDSKSSGKVYTIRGNRQVPLIDASHNLQIKKEDNNCSLYSFNFIQGIADMLGDELVADKVYHLAEQIDSGTESEKKAAQLALTTIFREDLKHYVPSYYDTNGHQKLYDQIKEHHLYQRWDLGSLGMETEFLRDNGYLAKAK